MEEIHANGNDGKLLIKTESMFNAIWRMLKIYGARNTMRIASKNIFQEKPHAAKPSSSKN